MHCQGKSYVRRTCAVLDMGMQFSYAFLTVWISLIYLDFAVLQQNIAVLVARVTVSKKQQKRKCMLIFQGMHQKLIGLILNIV